MGCDFAFSAAATFGNHSHSEQQKSEPRKRTRPACFACKMLRIGSWTQRSIYPGDVIVRFYFAKREIILCWLSNGAGVRLVIPFRDVTGLASGRESALDCWLTVTYSCRPLLQREIDPLPGMASVWTECADYSHGNQLTSSRQATIIGLTDDLRRPVAKLLEVDSRLKELYQSSTPGATSPELPISAREFAERQSAVGRHSGVVCADNNPFPAAGSLRISPHVQHERSPAPSSRVPLQISAERKERLQSSSHQPANTPWASNGILTGSASERLATAGEVGLRSDMHRALARAVNRVQSMDTLPWHGDFASLPSDSGSSIPANASRVQERSSLYDFVDGNHARASRSSGFSGIYRLGEAVRVLSRHRYAPHRLKRSATQRPLLPASRKKLRQRRIVRERRATVGVCTECSIRLTTRRELGDQLHN